MHVSGGTKSTASEIKLNRVWDPAVIRKGANCVILLSSNVRYYALYLVCRPSRVRENNLTSFIIFCRGNLLRAKL